MNLNRNKKSITLNLKSEEGKKLFLELVKKSDVLLENFSPGTMGKYGFLDSLDVYEGEFCAFKAFGYDYKWDITETLNDIGNTWCFANSSIKPYPCCRYGGPNIDACIDIWKNNKIDLNNIKSITAST